jgi:hypothetical protein
MTLAADIITDLDVFLNADEFARAATYAPTYTEYPAVDISAMQLGYPTILTSVDHGLPAGTNVTLAGFSGDDADRINAQAFAVYFPADDTIVIDLDTTGLDISVGEPAPTATPVYPDEIETSVLFNREDAAAYGMEGTRIWIQGKTSLFSMAKPGETITIDGTAYKIKSPPVHGDDGMSIIELSID